GKGSDFARRLGTRNLIWCFVKCMPAPLFWPLLPLHVLGLVFLLARALVRGNAAPVWAGLAEGIAGLPAIWRSRGELQSGRRASWRQIAGALTWNPIVYLRRAARARPILP